MAERVLRSYGDLTREQAAAVLPFWRYYRDLPEAERAAGPGPLPRAASRPGGGTAVNRRYGPCRHCKRPLAFDPEGRPIHTSREYTCRDRWGMLADTRAELPPAVGRATPPPAARHNPGWSR
jgi:hypothetical protein